MSKKAGKKIEYQKPEILDLGPVVPIHGGTDCLNGDVASGAACSDGDAAGNCSWGDNAVTLLRPNPSGRP